MARRQRRRSSTEATTRPVVTPVAALRAPRPRAFETTTLAVRQAKDQEPRVNSSSLRRPSALRVCPTGPQLPSGATTTPLSIRRRSSFHNKDWSARRRHRALMLLALAAGIVLAVLPDGCSNTTATPACHGLPTQGGETSPWCPTRGHGVSLVAEGSAAARFCWCIARAGSPARSTGSRTGDSEPSASGGIGHACVPVPSGFR